MIAIVQWRSKLKDLHFKYVNWLAGQSSKQAAKLIAKGTIPCNASSKVTP